jgi:membrane protein
MNRLRRRWHRRRSRVLVRLKQVSLPGFQGMSVLEVLQFFWTGLNDVRFTLLAAAMAYQFFFSLFPLILLMFIIFPRIPVPDLEARAIHFLRQIVPEEGLQLAENIVRGAFQEPGDLWLLALSVVLALWGALRGIIAMMKAFTKQEEVFRRRTFWQLHGMAFVILMAFSGLILAAILLQAGLDVLISRGQSLGWIGSYWASGIVGWAGVLITLLTIFFAISMIYYLAPPTQERWQFISPGGVIAGGLTWLAIAGLKVYFANFTDYDQLYGSVGALIVLMVWFYYISIVLLIGFELNAAIDLATWHREHRREPPADPAGDA